NPNIKYPAPKRADGTERTTSFTAAWRNGFDPVSGTAVNLSTHYRPTAYLNLASNSTTEAFMGHYSADFRCNTSSSRCQYLTNGTWTNSPAGTTCPSSIGNTTARNNF